MNQSNSTRAIKSSDWNSPLFSYPWKIFFFKVFSAYYFHIYWYSPYKCILITPDWLLLNRGHKMRGRIHDTLIKTCRLHMQCCICLVKSTTCLAKATNKSFLSLQLNNFSSVYIQETLFFFTLSRELLLNCAVHSLFLTKYRTVTRGSISVRWHHPHRREHWDSSSLCVWYKWFGFWRAMFALG